MINIGNVVKINKCKTNIVRIGYAEQKEITEITIIEGIVEDVFDSADGTFKCFYIKGSSWLYTEHDLAQ